MAVDRACPGTSHPSQGVDAADLQSCCLRLYQYDWLPKKRAIALDCLVECLLLGLAQRPEWFEHQQYTIFLDDPLPCPNNLAIDHDHNAEGDDDQLTVVRVKNGGMVFVGNRVFIIAGQQMRDR